jgi:Flp pilus assembly protein protease CpaA
MGFRFLCFLILILWTTVQDLRFRRIPNRAVLFGFVSAFCLAWGQGGAGACLRAAEASALGFLIHWPAYCRRNLGGGDVKLFSAYCALCGLSHLSKLIPAYGVCLAALLVFAKIKGAVRKRHSCGLDSRSDERAETGNRAKVGVTAPLAPWMAMAVILSML